MKNDSTYRYGGHVHANGIRQHYLRYGGKGEPLVIIPGITSPAATWGFVGDRLGRSFDTYVLDVRGRGLSAGGPGLRYDLDTCAKDVADFASALGLTRYRVLGHSLGARIGARLGRLYGAPLARLVLVDPPLSGPGRRPYVKDLAFYIDAIREAQAGKTDIEVVRRTYPHWGEEQLRTRAEWLHTCDEAAIAASHRGLQEEEIHGDFPAIRTPTQLLIAGKGGVITEEDAAEVRRLMPAIEVAWIRHATHMIPFDNLEAFIGVVEPFLAQDQEGQSDSRV
ncbi:MAG: alpha/beta hydrolase [Betaproteobacteria bacterium]|nr:alpha/beta hydrolase [Betaproteobacteria bacterium]